MPPRHAHSGSETRQRTELVALRLLPQEREVLEAAALARGISLSALLRVSALREAAKPHYLAEDTINEP